MLYSIAWQHFTLLGEMALSKEYSDKHMVRKAYSRFEICFLYSRSLEQLVFCSLATKPDVPFRGVTRATKERA